MTPADTQLCHGRRYQQPYESSTSVWRRFLTVNPAVSPARLRAGLQRLGPDDADLDRHLKAWCQSPQVPVLSREYPGPTRQCPVCARGLYHCSLFNLPWLQYCPLHDQALLAACPDCQRPWPHRWDIADRACPTCGCPSVMALSAGCQNHLPPTAYQVLARLDADLQKLDAHRATLLAYPTEKSLRWRLLTPSDWAFGAVLQTLAPSPNPAPYAQWMAQVDGRRSHRYPLSPDHYHRPRDWSSWLTDRIAIRLHLRDAAASLAQKHIVHWIQRQMPGTHRITPGHFVLRSLADFQARPPPCPFCLALSLWLEHLKQSLTPEGPGLQLEQYPFLWELRQAPLHDLTPLLCLDDGNGLRALPETAFLHLYHTGLIQVFFDLMRVAFLLHHELQPEDGLAPEFSASGRWGYYVTIHQGRLWLNLMAGQPTLGNWGPVLTASRRLVPTVDDSTPDSATGSPITSVGGLTDGSGG